MTEYDCWIDGRWIGTVMATDREDALRAMRRQYIVEGSPKVAERDHEWEE